MEALFFGDFLLGLQKKVTRPPGRNPGALPARQTTPKSAAANKHEARSNERLHHLPAHAIFNRQPGDEMGANDPITPW
jgi:hypothetical protein